MLTVAEYQALTPLKRIGYRLYRNPFVMVLIGAPLTFILLQRLPTGHARHNREARHSILLLNLALIAVFGLPMLVFGIGSAQRLDPCMSVTTWQRHLEIVLDGIRAPGSAPLPQVPAAR